MDEQEILNRKENPIRIHKGIVYLPSWLNAEAVNISSLPKYNSNWNAYDTVMNYQCKFYGAEYWYERLRGVTPRSKLIRLDDDDVYGLLQEDDRYFTDRLKVELVSGLQESLNFIKSSKKSSHSKSPVYSLDDCLKELCDYADVLYSIKNGCRYLFMREYLSDITAEYRCILHHGHITYIERYVGDTHVYPSIKYIIMQFLQEQVLPKLHYMDATIDLACLRNGTYTVIEINTPPYLLAGLSLMSTERERDILYSGSSVILRWKDNFGRAKEI